MEIGVKCLHDLGGERSNRDKLLKPGMGSVNLRPCLQHHPEAMGGM